MLERDYFEIWVQTCSSVRINQSLPLQRGGLICLEIAFLFQVFNSGIWIFPSGMAEYYSLFHLRAKQNSFGGLCKLVDETLRIGLQWEHLKQAGDFDMQYWLIHGGRDTSTTNWLSTIEHNLFWTEKVMSSREQDLQSWTPPKRSDEKVNNTGTGCNRIGRYLYDWILLLPGDWRIGFQYCRGNWSRTQAQTRKNASIYCCVGETKPLNALRLACVYIRTRSYKNIGLRNRRTAFELIYFNFTSASLRCLLR